MKTNNVTRFLEARKVPFTAFELPEEKLGAAEAAQFLGVPPALVYKTIVVTREGKGKPVLAVVPGDREVIELLARRLARRNSPAHPPGADGHRFAGGGHPWHWNRLSGADRRFSPGVSKIYASGASAVEYPLWPPRI
jgi:hypothetical protein